MQGSTADVTTSGRGHALARAGARAVGAVAGGTLVVAALWLGHLLTGIHLPGLLGVGFLAGVFLLARPIADRIGEPGGRARRLVWLLAFQAAALAVMIFAPFGFDRPSPLGLDFDDLLLVGLLYVAAALLGALGAAVERRWAMLALQIGIPATLVALLATGPLAV